MTLRLGDTLIAGSGANQDLSNLTSTGQNIANWSNNVTNCITEIPQDIKLELNNGTLTLKAGNKVYVPNGFESDGTTPKFDAITIENDLSISSGTSWAIGQYLFYYNSDTHILDQSFINNTTSGSSAPSSLGEAAWYNTTENKIRRYNSQGTSYNQISLPFCLCSNSTGNLFESIDQVFNGFGYIGSTIFALPGVKGLIPDGRNKDGSLKNIEFTITGVKTDTIDAYWTVQDWFLYNDTTLTWYPLQAGEVNYDESKNFWLDKRVASGVSLFYNLGHTTASNGRITSFTPKTAFHALDYNDSPTISGWAMPSSRYIDLTIGAHGATYTAPANGWFAINGYAVSGAFLWIKVNDLYMQAGATYSSSAKGGVVAPCKKGDTVQVGYYGGALDYVRLVYAEGENV